MQLASQKNFALEIPDSFLPEEPENVEGEPSFSDFDVELSLCGEFFQQDIITPWEADECLDIFYKYEINFEDFCFNPSVASDPNLVVRINGRLACVTSPFYYSHCCLFVANWMTKISIFDHCVECIALLWHSLT